MTGIPSVTLAEILRSLGRRSAGRVQLAPGAGSEVPTDARGLACREWRRQVIVKVLCARVAIVRDPAFEKPSPEGTLGATLQRP